MFVEFISKLFKPNDPIFFVMLENSIENIDELASKLCLMVLEPGFNKRADLVFEMKELEAKNDDINHTISLELSKNYITPFDREDLLILANALDDISDYIFLSAHKIHFYKLDPTQDANIQSMAKAIQKCVALVKKAIYELRHMKNIKKIAKSVLEISKLENEVDDSFDQSIINLFDSENDIKCLLKKREVYRLLETVTDKCEDAGLVMESIVIKYG